MTDTAPAPAPRPRRHPARRQAELAGGVLLVVVTPAVAILPGPAGTIVFAGGMVLILRNSHWARLRWARLKRRFPRIGGFIDRMMRRGSALRRHARDKMAAEN
ncbi:hypothetical protein [Sphingomonas sp. GB1N7]|uniref:hypothetical protein n=1 Tax=Parasphingomonas caseinilytica TaxID=3096158 RepID=UPI002FCAF459